MGGADKGDGGESHRQARKVRRPQLWSLAPPSALSHTRTRAQASQAQGGVAVVNDGDDHGEVDAQDAKDLP